MIIPIRILYVCFTSLILFFVSIYSYADGSDDENLRRLAKRTLTLHSLYKTLGLLQGPLFVAIDGPPAVGKSMASKPLREYISNESQARGFNLVVDVFPQDRFLHSSAHRDREFSQLGCGLKGNCNGREYRWDAATECVESISRGALFCGAFYRMHGEERHGEVLDGQIYDATDTDILIFEGTHALGDSLGPYMHLGIFLDASNQLIRNNRLLRSVTERRGWENSLQIAAVAESQYPTAIRPNAHRANMIFHIEQTGELPSDNQIRHLESNTPRIPRTMRTTNRDHYRINLSPSQRRALALFQEDTSLATSHRSLGEMISRVTGPFWSELYEFLQTNALELHLPDDQQEAANDSFFASLTQGYDFSSLNTRDNAISGLRYLQHQLSTGNPQLPQGLSTLITNNILEQEINSLREGETASLMTLVLLWTVTLQDNAIPVQPIFIRLRVGNNSFTLGFYADGTYRRVDEMPANVNVLIFDGTHSWMWAEPRMNENQNASGTAMNRVADEGDSIFPDISFSDSSSTSTDSSRSSFDSEASTSSTNQPDSIQTLTMGGGSSHSVMFAFIYFSVSLAKRFFETQPALSITGF